MGQYYTNITLRGPEQAYVAQALSGRRSLVSPKVNGCTVVFDADCDAQFVQTLSALSTRLSQQFRCPALAVLNHFDEVLWFGLYDGGTLADVYQSRPSYFAPDLGDTPAGGDIRKLARAFGRPCPEKSWAKVLRTRGIPARERHVSLADTLGIPWFVAGCGFDSLSSAKPAVSAVESSFILTA